MQWTGKKLPDLCNFLPGVADLGNSLQAVADLGNTLHDAA